MTVGSRQRDGKGVGVGVAAAAQGLGFRHRMPRRLRVVNPGACTHELVVERGLDGPRLETFGLVPRVGDPGLRERVGEQELGRLVHESKRCLHTLEHAPHPVGVESGAFQGVEADPVRLLLAGAAETQRLVLGVCLGAEQRGHPGLAAPAGGDGQRGKQTGEHPGRHGALLLDAAGVVALAQVREFVGDDRRVFALVVGIEKQAEIDADDAPRHGERVDLGVVDQHGGQRGLADARKLREAVDIDLDVVLEDRIRDRGDARANLLQRDLGEFPFGCGRYEPGRPVAEFRQLRGLGSGNGEGQGQDGQAAQRRSNHAAFAESWDRDHTR